MSGGIFAPTPENIERAGRAIREGSLVAFPTETVYGLGADALSHDAVARIFEAKGRPQDNPLIAHVADMDAAERIAVFTPLARALAEAFWPGPMTLVLRARDILPAVTRAGLTTAAIRMPRHETALALIRAAGVPIAAPSANRSGRPSPTDAKTVAADLGAAVAMIIDGGPTEIGVESTVIDATGGAALILRQGGVTAEMIASVAPLDGADPGESARRSPGTRHRHYAPSCPVALWSADGGAASLHAMMGGKCWAYMGITPPPPEAGEPSRARIFKNSDDYARGLFAALRDLERIADMIAAELPPDSGGITPALRDRLIRASGEGAGR